jgi:hypothetical protein
MGIAETNSLFLSLNHWAALAASVLFVAEAIMLGLAVGGRRGRGLAAETAGS